MAGYDGYSMSNNARSAYDAGELPASKAATEFRRQGFKSCTTADVRSGLIRSSWHHTSKKFNATDFYETSLEPEEAEKLREVIIARTNRPFTMPEIYDVQYPLCAKCGCEFCTDMAAVPRSELCGQCQAEVYVSCNPSEAWRFVPGGKAPFPTLGGSR